MSFIASKKEDEQYPIQIEISEAVVERIFEEVNDGYMNLTRSEAVRLCGTLAAVLEKDLINIIKEKS